MIKRLRVLFASLCSFLLLAACSPSANPVGSTGEGGVSTPKKDPVELVVYFPFVADWNEEQFMQAFGNPIQQKFPHVRIRYITGGGGQGTSVAERLAAGERIDILFASVSATPPHLLENALQYDISPLIKKYNYDVGPLDPSMVETARKMAEGGIYGLPVYVPPAAIYYNKDIFDKFGVPYPKDGITWDELFELNKRLTRKEGDVQYFGLGSSYGHFVQFNQRSIPLVDTATKKATFATDPRWKGFLENFLRFYQIPGFELQSNQMSEPNERNRFFKDRIIAMFLAMTALHQSTEINDMNWDLAPFPVFADNPGVGPQANPTYFYVTTMSEHKDQAFEVIAYLTSPEFQAPRAREGRFLTTLTDRTIRESFGKENPMYQGKNVKAFWPLKYASAGSVNKYNSTASGELQTAIKDVLLQKTDLNTALREAAERMNKKIEEAEAAAK